VYLSVCNFGFNTFCKLFFVLNATFKFVFRKIFVIFLVSFPIYVKVAHFIFCFSVYSLYFWCLSRAVFNFLFIVIIQNVYIYCTLMAVLVGLQTTPLNISHSLLPTTPSVLQSSVTSKQFSLNVLTTHSFRRLSWPSTIPIGADYSPSTLGSRWLFSRQLLSWLSLADSPD
jgi:hypothetical protein